MSERVTLHDTVRSIRDFNSMYTQVKMPMAHCMMASRLMPLILLGFSSLVLEETPGLESLARGAAGIVLADTCADVTHKLLIVPWRLWLRFLARQDCEQVS